LLLSLHGHCHVDKGLGDFRKKKILQYANDCTFWHDIQWFISALTAQNPVTSFVINVSANTATLAAKHKL